MTSGGHESGAALIARTAEHVRQLMSGEGTGHDWWHVHRVWQMAMRICGDEHADPIVVQLGALLHDVADWKFHDGDQDAGPARAREWLTVAGLDAGRREHVCRIVSVISFKGAGVADQADTPEARIVQDADRLDAIGAIGIARAFAYGGFRSRALYDPDIPPNFHGTPAEYRANTSPTINHFHEKLLLLKDRMLTESGGRIAEERHEFMLRYLDRFGREWDGEA